MTLFSCTDWKSSRLRWRWRSNLSSKRACDGNKNVRMPNADIDASSSDPTSRRRICERKNKADAAWLRARMQLRAGSRPSCRGAPSRPRAAPGGPWPAYIYTYTYAHMSMSKRYTNATSDAGKRHLGGLPWVVGAIHRSIRGCYGGDGIVLSALELELELEVQVAIGGRYRWTGLVGTTIYGQYMAKAGHSNSSNEKKGTAAKGEVAMRDVGGFGIAPRNPRGRGCG